MAFVGRHVLVAGGAGNIGTGVTLALLQQGAKVTIASRSIEKFKAVQNQMPAGLRKSLLPVCSSVSSEDGVKEIFEQTTKQGGGVHHVVASIGALWQKGKLIDQPVSEIYEALQAGFISHFLLFKQFLPYLEKVPGSTYTMLTGNAAEKYIFPNTSLISIMSGALNGMSVGMLEEHKDSPVAITDFRIHFFVQPQDKEFPATENFVMGNDVMGQAIVASVVKKTRGRLDLRNRKETHLLASQLKK